MKQYRYKEYGGNGKNKHGYRKSYKKKTTAYYITTTPPWKSYQKTFHST